MLGLHAISALAIADAIDSNLPLSDLADLEISDALRYKLVSINATRYSLTIVDANRTYVASIERSNG